MKRLTPVIVTGVFAAGQVAVGARPAEATDRSFIGGDDLHRT